MDFREMAEKITKDWWKNVHQYATPKLGLKEYLVSALEDVYKKGFIDGATQALKPPSEK